MFTFDPVYCSTCSAEAMTAAAPSFQGISGIFHGCHDRQIRRHTVFLTEEKYINHLFHNRYQSFHQLHLYPAVSTSIPLCFISVEGVRPMPKRPNRSAYVQAQHRLSVLLGTLPIACQYSLGNSSISSQRNTGPSLHTYLEPMLQRPHLPTPHFIRSSRVV